MDGHADGFVHSFGGGKTEREIRPRPQKLVGNRVPRNQKESGLKLKNMLEQTTIILLIRALSFHSRFTISPFSSLWGSDQTFVVLAGC